jgi:hypothetical protein
MRRIVLAVLLLALLLAACGSSKSKATNGDASDRPWPAPPNPMELARKAGLEPEVAERLQFHVHAHLDVFINGKQIVVPGGIGIDIKNPKVHDFGDDTYGGITEPCDTPCISPLHTHDPTGLLHTESATEKLNTLGQFFIEWNVKLDSNCVDTYCKPETPISITVNGKAFTGDPTTIPLANQAQIVIRIGSG